MNSYYDDKGRLYVACCECTRGGNGNDKDKCCCGWKIKKWDGRGCYIGKLNNQLKDK